MESMKISMASLKATGRMKYDCEVSMVNHEWALLETTGLNLNLNLNLNLIVGCYLEEIRLQRRHC
jgi:hypothetical protein